MADPFHPQGGEPHPVRATALKLIEQQEDEMSDAAHLMQQTDAFWWHQYCIEQFHQPPSMVDRWIMHSDYTNIRAAEIVKSAYTQEARKHKSYFSDTE